MINKKPRKKAEDSSKLYFPDRNTPSTRKNNRRTQKDGNHKIYKSISKQPSARKAETKQKRHTKKFWKTVELICPNYKEPQEQLTNLNKHLDR